MTISEFLRTLTVKEEDRVLTGKMKPGAYYGPCLVGRAVGVPAGRSWALVAHALTFGRLRRRCESRTPGDYYDGSVEEQYDIHCRVFGIAATNAEIRTEVLANRARRELTQPKPKTLPVESLR